ncbi:ATP-grasp domain-containing protein [bacterium]|nr:ATP-grasp domain-containing protein [bacterium]
MRWAKEMGLSVALTDKNPENYGRELADYYGAISGNDISALLDFGTQINNKYELVGAYCSNDFGLPAVGALSERFNLYGNTINAINNALDKQIAKRLWDNAGLRIPRWVAVTDRDSLFKAVDKIGFPLICKPINSSGSRGVRSVWGFESLDDAFMDAKRFSENILIEELISGRHIDINALFVNDEFYPCGTMERFFSEIPFHYPIWGFEPSSLSEKENDIAYNILEHAARCLGINKGPVKADIIWSDKGPVLIEIAPRFHGDVSTSYVTPLVCNTSPIKAWFAYLSGNQYFQNYIPRSCIQYAGYMALFPSGTGTLVDIKGIDKAYEIEGISDIYLCKSRGHKIQKHKDNTSLCGFIWASGKSKDDLYKTLRFAKDVLIFEVE